MSQPTNGQLFDMVRLALLDRADYYASVAYNVQVVEWGVPTLAVTDDWRLMYNPNLPWTLAEYAAVFEHELNHLMREHCGRMAGRDAGTWNVAGDMEINDDLTGLPDGALTPQKEEFNPRETAEVYYDLLVKKSKAPKPKHSCGSGAGNPHPDEPSGGSKPNDGSGQTPHTGPSAVEKAAVIQATAEAIKAAGNAPAGLKRWASQYTTEPRRSWIAELTSIARRSLETAAAENSDYTWTRLSRRSAGDMLRPGLIAYGINAAIVIDTSGSIDETQLANALTQVTGIIEACGCAVTTFSVDAAVHSKKKARRARDVELKGGGGTDMGVGIHAALAVKPVPDVIIVLTDGLTPWPSSAPRSRVIVAVPAGGPATPAWAKRVEIG